MSSFYILEAQEAAAGSVIVTAGGEIDFAASPRLREVLFGQIRHGARQIVLDLAGASFIDSTAIGVLAGALGRLRSAGGGSLSVVCPENPGLHLDERLEGPANVRRVLEISGLDTDLLICDSLDEALRELDLAR